jgi:hypothetical protein
MTIGEAGITFYSAGGHNHDGINSSRINSTRYSVWDWEWDIITSAEPSRLLRQDLNYKNFTRSIIDIINNSILSPAGVRLQPGSLVGSAISANTITADQIQTGTITADLIRVGTITGDLFNANVVLVNQIIKSNNYVTGVSGWAIAGDGTAEFDSASIRGAITASAIIVNDDNFWSANGFNLGGDTGIYTDDGIVFIGTSVKIEGTIIAQQLAINEHNRWNAEGFILGGNTGIFTNNGVIYIGTDVVVQANVTANAFSIDDDNFWNAEGFALGGDTGIYTDDGIVYIGTSVEIEGVIEADELAINDDNFWNAGGFKLGGDKGIRTVKDEDGTNLGVRIGENLIALSNGTIASENFTIFANGAATFSGEIEADSGYIGSWLIENGNLRGITENQITTTLDANGNLRASGTIEGTSVVAYNSTIGAFYAPNGGFTVKGDGNVQGLGIAYTGPVINASTPFVAFQSSGSTLYAILNNQTVLTLATSSDIKFKRNIVDLENTYVEKLLNHIRVVQFNSFDEKTNEIDMSVKRSGVIAQDVINVFPDIVDDVNKDGSSQYSLTINYSGFVPYLIKTVQYLSDKINNLTERLDALEQ